ncbi:MAG TPA: hypothetical protein VLQ68_00335 [Rhizobiaceae bacterium]|nr:hypothetical protein [Rhizobiaceae bacterium]
MRLTIFVSALISAAAYLGMLPAFNAGPLTPAAIATGVLITLTTVHGLAKG